ncbi:hypothetical protein ACFYPC_21405 [Streptomyces sp. NPDC005808]|uniref:hypothetical protein n=1 Tax=Streptomyces sp. NPDC005808 TaxID=3364734 RepID=UPI0036CB6DA5
MKTAGAFVGVVALAVAALLFTAWVVMLLVGMWHGYRDAVPPIGFNESLLVVVLAGILTGAGTAAKQ